MPIERLAANGARQNATTTITVPWPANHLPGDIGLLIIETANQTVSLTTAAGFVQVTNSPQGTGAAGGTTSAGLAVYWCRATSNAQASPITNDPGDHVHGIIVGFRGVRTTGDPWDITAGTTGASGTGVTFPTVTTTFDGCFVVCIVNNATDSATAQGSGYTHGGLESFGELTNLNMAASGNGGGWSVADGRKLVAGATGTGSCTLGTASVQAIMTISLVPAGAPPFRRKDNLYLPAY
jgi:hypothetical protein